MNLHMFKLVCKCQGVQGKDQSHCVLNLIKNSTSCIAGKQVALPSVSFHKPWTNVYYIICHKTWACKGILSGLSMK